MSSPLRILEEGEVGDFVLRDASKANPRGLTQAVAIRYKDSGPSEPMAVIFRGIYRLKLKSGCFSVNLNAESVRPIKDSGPWNPPILPPSSIKFLSLPPDRICLTSNRLVIYMIGLRFRRKLLVWVGDA